MSRFLPLLLPVLLLAACTNATEADKGKASPVGLLVLVLFLIAVALLVRSMTKHLKRVPESFDTEDEPTAAEPAGEPEPGAPADGEAGRGDR